MPRIFLNNLFSVFFVNTFPSLKDVKNIYAKVSGLSEVDDFGSRNDIVHYARGVQPSGFELLTCQSQVNRLDINWNMPAPKDASPAREYSQGMAKKLLSQISGSSEFVDQYIVDRVGVTAILLVCATQPEQACAWVKEKVTNIKELNYQKHRDFSYTINSPITQKVGTMSVSVNRISNWSLLGYGIKSPQPNIYAMVKLDINTDSEVKLALKGSEAIILLGDLAIMLEELAEKGDHVGEQDGLL